MSVDLKKFGQRLDSLLKNPKKEFIKNPTRIKQKDLAKDIGVSENAIKHWKDGDWDIRLSNIYLIVKYVQDHFKGSSRPMQILFSDLLADEIQRVREDAIRDYQKEWQREKTNLVKDYEKRIKSLQEEIERPNNELEKVRKHIRSLSDVNKAEIVLALESKEITEILNIK